MVLQRTRHLILLLAFGLVLALAAGCRADGVSPTPSPGQAAATATAPATLPPAATTVAPPPTPTPEPLAVIVNGEGISLAEFDVELRQIQEAHQELGKTIPLEQQRQQVLDNLIDTLLLAQGAFEGGFRLSDEDLQAEIDRLDAQGELAGWMARYGYTETIFSVSLRRQLAAAWQRDQLAAGVPESAEQIHACQILVLYEDTAKRAREQVAIPGVNFAAYAYLYDPLTGGDLGWFPRGYLTQPAVEEAVFQLQPGEISQVIHSEIGYHILQVISREPSRPISPDARRVMAHQAISEWLDARREASSIEVMLE